MKGRLLFGALIGVLAAFSANAQNSVIPQVNTINSGDLFQDIVNGQETVQGFYASQAFLSGYFAQNAQSDNFLIGGDAGQNLWQRGTTGSSVTTTVTYGGPDRWAYWSGASTAMTVTRSNTAAALPTGAQYAFRMQRTAAQTGLVQMCMAQEIASQNAFYLAGHTVEVDFNFYTGANFSATAVNAYVVYGTTTDEGMTNLAFGLNAGGGGAAGWTGQANASAGLISGLAVSTAYRGAVVASLPSTAQEAAVVLCYTPTGTAGTTDAVYWSDIELRKADSLVVFANATTGYTVYTSSNASLGYINATIGANTQNAIIPSFSRRLSSLEASLQYTYFWQISEPAASLPVATGAGAYYTSTTCEVPFQFPVPMRVAPTVAFGGTTLGATTFAIIANSATPIVLATSYLVQSTLAATNTTVAGRLKATTAAQTAGQACELVGAGGGANIQWSAEL